MAFWVVLRRGSPHHALGLILFAFAISNRPLKGSCTASSWSLCGRGKPSGAWRDPRPDRARAGIALAAAWSF